MMMMMMLLSVTLKRPHRDLAELRTHMKPARVCLGLSQRAGAVEELAEEARQAFLQDVPLQTPAAGPGCRLAPERLPQVPGQHVSAAPEALHVSASPQGALLVCLCVSLLFPPSDMRNHVRPGGTEAPPTCCSNPLFARSSQSKESLKTAY